MGSGSGKVVCVTGASGYIASCLVKLLLGHGYTVKATVRDPGDPKKTAHLLALDGAQERLHLFKADLLTPDCFDSVVEGCHGVFHTASPAFMSSSNPQVDLIDPAVKGTLNVLKSCAKASSIKRVVLTSSVATIAYNGKPVTVIDETCFSDLAFCEQPKRWYVLSKILAEEAAVKFAKDNEIDLVIMNPGHVIGPLLQPTLNLSVEIITNLIKGVRTFISSSCRYVDVRDVAFAHLRAFEIPSATGRYLLVGRTAHHSEVMRILHQLYPTLISPNMYGYYLPLEATLEISKEKAKTLGICFTPLEVSLKDTIESLKEKNLLCIPTVTQSSLPS